MGAHFWQPQSASHLKKCSEFVSPACDPVQTDGCCAVVACSYCLTYYDYSGGIYYGTAVWVGDGWEGDVEQISFRGFWERNYQSGECEFVVTFNGHEIYRNDCYGGQSCRDSSDAVDVNNGFNRGTLYWSKIDPLELQHVVDSDSYCRRTFCSDCECSCDCLCVTIIEGYGPGSDTGEICNTSYTCDPPVWEGTVGAYSLSLALGRDPYNGECIITPTVNGTTYDAVGAPGCASMAATITLPDSTTISVRCKTCSCTTESTCCGRDLPLDCVTGAANTSAGKLPLTLTCDLTATPSFGSSTCFNGSGTLTFKTPLTGGLCCYEGRISGTCTDCNGNSFSWYTDMTVCCGDSGWTVSSRPGSPCTQGTGFGNATIVPAVCNPVLLSGCFTDKIVGCVVACTLTMPPTSGPTYTLCFEIYETP
jgi:hypothetical protein